MLGPEGRTTVRSGTGEILLNQSKRVINYDTTALLCSACYGSFRTCQSSKREPLAKHESAATELRSAVVVEPDGIEPTTSCMPLMRYDVTAKMVGN